MTEFLRDHETGYLYAYRDGKLIGPIVAMGEKPPAKPSCDLWEREHVR